MKIPFSWLKEHVFFSQSVQQVADDLVSLGHEVESIEKPREAVKGVRVGKIVSMQSHPDADKLHLLQIDIGEDEPLAIVCGASNMGEGDKIPVATVGTLLPNGLKIKKGKIRGQVSFGMCCSEAELGLAEDAAGLLILPKDAPVGAEVGDYLELEEAVLDLDITPNRGDCMSARGLARDLAADYDLPLINAGDDTVAIDSAIAVPSVDVSAPVDCPLYMARRIEGVSVADSPDWMQARLIAAGQRPVNGVVDVLNYTRLDLGQPMHAFDAGMLSGDICVRATQTGESFKALDGRDIALNAGDVVIADDANVIALAGIMGSEDTGVTEKTTNIILESAAFRAALIRTTRRTYGLVSESSMRFERGVDPAMIDVAMNQASTMIMDLFGGKASAISVVGDAESLVKAKTIHIDMQRIESRLGIDVDARFDDVLSRMGFGIQRDDNRLTVDVPSHRHDVSLFEDISEEYARVIGFDAIPEVLPNLATINPRKVDTAISSAVALGFVQVINYAFVSADEQRLFVEDDGKDLILQNPISADMSVMRRSAWAGLLNTAKYNMNRQQAGVALVEQGRIYAKVDADKQNDEHRESNVIAWLMAGQLESDSWHGKARKADFFDLKGAVESWLANRGLTARFMVDDDVQGLQSGQTAKIFVGKSVVGHVGKVDADLAAGFDIDADVFVASVNLDALHKGKTLNFQPIPEFPSVERDLVFLFERGTESEAVLQTAKRAAGQSC
ncbi:MAG: phenylalanine--tRNA ligase subunit beta, partial [Mariprofundaceae bacterium]|nr:phenylalanine--tRNA ligase subunit beta [Mariprofundaceae bacterium]